MAGAVKPLVDNLTASLTPEQRAQLTGMGNLKSSEQGQNDLNIKLHALPWYQTFLAQNGQNPQRVKLNDAQRQQLQSLAAQNGVTLPKGVQFDPSGNVNEQHGFAGQPGWLKALEVSGALAGSIFAPGVQGALGGLLGGGGAAGGSTAAATGTLGSGMAAAGPASILGVTGGGAMAAAPALGASSILTGLSTASKLANGVLQTRDANRGAQAEYGLDSDRNRLQAAQLGLQSDRLRSQQLVGADLSEHFTPSADPRMAKFGTPQGLSPETIAAIRARAQQGLAGGDVPTLSTMPKPTGTDKLLNTLNYAGTAFDAFKKFGGMF